MPKPLFLCFLLFFYACELKKKDNVVYVQKENILLIPTDNYNSEKKYLVGSLALTKKDSWQTKEIQKLGKFELSHLKKNTDYSFINVSQLSLNGIDIAIYNPYHYADLEKLDNTLKIKVLPQQKDTIKFCQEDNMSWVCINKKDWFPLKMKNRRDNGVVITNIFYQKLKEKEYLMIVGNTMQGQGTAANIQQVFLIDLKNFDDYWYKQFDKNFSPNIIDDFDGDGNLEIIKYVYEPIFKDNF